MLLPASGDLRHVIKTINGLKLRAGGASGGDGGSGLQYRVHVHLNDHNPKVALRTLLVLLLLGSRGPEAADAAADSSIPRP